jgi:glycosyltransferase involved in cell wall biosynthesis
MKIAFYSPLKSPNHPVPSGDRLMARLLIEALTMAGHEVSVASELRSFQKDPNDQDQAKLDAEAQQEIEVISRLWAKAGKPDLWFCYHPYYKAGDLLGPELCQRFDLPYVTAEASYSRRRNEGAWARSQQKLLEAVRAAAVNICFTERDRNGLAQAAPEASLAMLPPFIDPSLFLRNLPDPAPCHLVTVAMMRPGDKLSSYAALAKALSLLPKHLPWKLSIVGDGPERAAVMDFFAQFSPDRIHWHGQKTPEEIAGILSTGALYVWPGHGEAYGLAYLEAQAAGLPVVAEQVAGVPEVVDNGRTGILTPPGDSQAYADAITDLLGNDSKRQAMAEQARRFATLDRSLAKAAIGLDDILNRHIGSGHDGKNMP